MLKSNRNQKIIFPENVTTTISKIMEKYGLKETGKEIIQKLKKGETPIGRVMSKTIAQRSMEEISAKDVPSIISKSLGVSDKIAGELANDIEKEIIIFVKKIPIEKEIAEEEKTVKESETIKITEKENLGAKDTYREPIE